MICKEHIHGGNVVLQSIVDVEEAISFAASDERNEMRHIVLGIAQDARAACPCRFKGRVAPDVLCHVGDILSDIGPHDGHGGRAGDTQGVHVVHFVHHGLKAHAVAQKMADIIN